MKNVIVPDANTFIKLLYPEPEHAQAKQFFKQCNNDSIRLIAPDLFRYEVIRVVHRYQDDIANMLALLENYERYGMDIVTPTAEIWRKAQTIASQGHVKSGYPSMYDAVYHAMAIVNDGIFVTADHRHYEKAKSFGHITLLAHWQQTFELLRTDERPQH